MGSTHDDGASAGEMEGKASNPVGRVEGIGVGAGSDEERMA